MAEPSPKVGASAPFGFALLGDPQIGYGADGDFSDKARFAQVVEAVNESDVELAIVAGDLVQDRNWLQRRLFADVRSRLRPKTLLVAGNHDVVDVASLERYRKDNGADYYDYVHGGTAFVIIDSETARSRAISDSEYNAQWGFIENALRAHVEAKRTQIVLALHRPPFVDDENEPDSERNWPRATRQRLLGLAREARVRWILAGHLHMLHEGQTHDGIRIVVGPGSARNFDASPIGFHHFIAAGDALADEWRVVGPTPPPPWHVPGFSGWTPRLVAFSMGHWLLTLAFALAGAFTWVAARAVQGRRAGEPRAWRGVGVALFFFAANMQLDLDEFVQEVARIAVKVVGINAIRHVVSATLLVVMVALSVVWLMRNMRAGRRSRALLTAIAALGVPTLWFALSMISHHDLGMLVSADTWDQLTYLSLAVICGCAAVAIRSSKVRHGV